MSKNIFLLIIFIHFIKCNPQQNEPGSPPDKNRDKDDLDIFDISDNKKKNIPNNNIHNNRNFLKESFNDLKRKKETVMKENINSKAKLKKINMIYNIIQFFNIIFASIISIYFLIKMYLFINKKRRQTKININASVSIENNDIENENAPPTYGNIIN